MSSTRAPRPSMPSCPDRRRPLLGGSAYLWCVARPVEALAAIPLETRRFEDLGALAAIPLETRRFEDLGRYQFEAMIERVRAAEQHAGELLGGRTVWMVNSTAVGGGVAQLLRTLLPYWRGAGIDVRWMVLRGSAEFFRVTKRFHNHLQGQPGDGDVLGIDELTTLDQAADQHARAAGVPACPRRRGCAQRPPDGSDVGAADAGWRERHLVLSRGHRPRQRVLSRTRGGA